ncbi:ABC transporter permease [Pseudoduganella rhizocola]|uniref:ABC transporter permease n=1 Tax=Pseudoduganella rhizocola TaxID=3382643 RepID=UPI0038B5BDE2
MIQKPKMNHTIQTQAPWRSLLIRFFRSPAACAAVLLLVLLCVAAAAAPWLAPQDPYDLRQVTIVESERAPGAQSDDGALTFLLGTDGAGRDVLSAILYGLRVSIVIGVASAVLALLIGTCVGLVSAHFGGRIDALLMRIVDVQLSLPTILVALVLLAVLGQGADRTLLALILVQWAVFARNVRGTALVERSKDYVEAARGQGLPVRRILFRHVLPNCLAPLIVTTTNQMASAITLEATMSFLGIGLPQTQPSLGLLISNGFDYMFSNRYWISVFPGIALVLLVVSISMVGDRLRVMLQPDSDA